MLSYICYVSLSYGRVMWSVVVVVGCGRGLGMLAAVGRILRVLYFIAVYLLATMNVSLVFALSGPGLGFLGCWASTCCDLCGHCLAELAGERR